MRIAILTIVSLLCLASSAIARLVPSLTYKELMNESDLVVIVHANDTRRPREGEDIVPLEYVDAPLGGPLTTRPLDATELKRFTPVVTEFQVLAVVKGTHDSDTLRICHYKYEAAAQQLENGPSFLVFPTGNATNVRGETWSANFPNHFMLFLKYDNKKRLTFVTGQYDPEGSVKQIAPPLPQD